MKLFHIICKLLVSLLIISPILGALGIFPAPTAAMYNTPEAYEFIQLLYAGGYIIYINAIVFLLAIIFLWTKREALGAALILPIVINIVGFHAFLDGGLLTGGAMMGNVLLILTLYFMYKNRAAYKHLLEKTV